MRGKFMWARTATLLIVAICCAVLLAGCGSTRMLFATVNRGEYEKALEIFHKIPEEKHEKILEEAKAYIETTETGFIEGKITLDVAVQRFGCISNFQMYDLTSPLDNAVKSVFDTYADQIAAEPDKIDLEASLEALDSLNGVYPYGRMYVSPLYEAQETIVQSYIDAEIAKVYDGSLDLDDYVSSVYVLRSRGNLYALATEAIEEYEYYQEIEMAFMDGKACFENENYADAIYWLSYVPSSNAHYRECSELIKSAKDKIVESQLAEAQMYADNHYYDQAIYILQNLLSSGYDFMTISDKIAEYESAKTEYLLITEFEQMADEARSAAAKGDYKSALTDISAFADENYFTASDEVWDMITEVYDEIESEYVTLIVGKVESLYENKDYLSAIKMLDNTIVSNTSFDELRAKIEAEKPVYLCEMDDVLVNSDRYGRVTDRIATDTIGNKYNSENVFCLTPHYDGYAQYYLGYKYDTLTGVIAPCDTSKNKVAVFRIIGDDKVICELEMQRTTTPVGIDLDVSSVNFVTFEVEYVSSDWGSTINPLLIDFSFTKSK